MQKDKFLEDFIKCAILQKTLKLFLISEYFLKEYSWNINK